jgi:hypothetical protein
MNGLTKSNFDSLLSCDDNCLIARTGTFVRRYDSISLFKFCFIQVKYTCKY